MALFWMTGVGNSLVLMLHTFCIMPGIDGDQMIASAPLSLLENI